jgi:tRNA-specific 2-thiouridylase
MTTAGKKPIAVAMSGGVDSSLAAALLLESGYPVIGLTLQFGSAAGPGLGCGADGARRARETAKLLGIPHVVIPAAGEFEREILRPAWAEYARGRTPSPCLSCNPRLKFGLLFERARDLGASALATGHYARRVIAGERARLLRGADPRRDQSYFLSRLSPEQLMGARFPLGEMSKDEVRRLAAALALPAAGVADSQDACLVQQGESFSETLRRRLGEAAREGEILDRAGRRLGTHLGIHRFTIGQRHGLPRAETHRPCWVFRIAPDPPRVIVTDREADLLSREFWVSGVVWHGAPSDELSGLVQVRHRQTAVPCRAVRHGDSLKVVLDSPLRAVTPGQAAVFYQADEVAASGWIERVE